MPNPDIDSLFFNIQINAGNRPGCLKTKNLPIKFAVSHKETLLERVSCKTALPTAIPEGPIFKGGDNK
jgi:hypothetical protein